MRISNPFRRNKKPQRDKLNLDAHYRQILKAHKAKQALARFQDTPSALALLQPPKILPDSPPVGQVSRPSAELDTFVTHPEVGLGPQRVISIFRNAENGWVDRQADLFTGTIELDGHLRSLITARQLAVTGKTWQLNAGGDDPASLVAADLLEQALREESNPQDLFSWILGARYYGYSGTEILWKQLDGDTIPDWFVTAPFRRFRFTLEGQPLFRNTFDEGQRLEPGRWCFVQNSGEFASNHARLGLLRTCVWYSLFKRWSWRDWTIYAEKFGIPLVIGKWLEGASEEAIDALEDAVENVGDDGQAVMPGETEIKIHESQRSGGSEGLHASIVNEANIEMSKLITGSPLLAQAGGPGATFALGKVQSSRAFDLVLADAKFVGDTFARYVATPFMKWNGFPPSARPPRLQIHVSQEVDPLTRAKIQQIMHQMKLPLDSEQLRTEHQLRKPPTPERTLEIGSDDEPSQATDESSQE